MCQLITFLLKVMLAAMFTLLLAALKTNEKAVDLLVEVFLILTV